MSAEMYNPLALIIEDDAGLRHSLDLTMREYGFAVQLAYDTQEARALVEQKMFDVIVVDLSFGNQEGVTLLERVQHRRTLKHALVTVLAPDKSATDGLVRPVHQVLIQPIYQHDLRYMADRLMRSLDASLH